MLCENESDTDSDFAEFEDETERFGTCLAIRASVLGLDDEDIVEPPLFRARNSICLGVLIPVIYREDDTGMRETIDTRASWKLRKEFKALLKKQNFWPHSKRLLTTTPTCMGIFQWEIFSFDEFVELGVCAQNRVLEDDNFTSVQFRLRPRVCSRMPKETPD